MLNPNSKKTTKELLSLRIPYMLTRRMNHKMNIPLKAIKKSRKKTQNLKLNGVIMKLFIITHREMEKF